MIPDNGRHWWNDGRVFCFHFARSTYITAIWNWFLGLMGRAAEPVLVASVLYASAKMLPIVHFPPWLDAMVFVAQFVALDVGGLSLGKLAKQARREGNDEGAQHAKAMSNALISVMIAGVVVVSLEQLFRIPGQVQTGIDTVLLIARAVLAVFYGRVIHDLKSDTEDLPTTAQPVPAPLPSLDMEALTQAITQQVEAASEARFEARLRQIEAASEARFTSLLRQQITVSEAPVTPQLTAPKRPREARKPLQETGLHVLPLRQPGAALSEKRAAVYRLVERDARLSSYTIAEQTGIPVSTVQRYLKDWKAAQREATGTEA
jgi:hypothetical protein